MKNVIFCVLILFGWSLKQIEKLKSKHFENSEVMNEWMMHLYSALLYIVVHQKRFTIMWGGGLYSTTTNVQHPLGWCDGCHRTAAPVCYRWRGERVIEPIKWMRSPHTKSNQIKSLLLSHHHSTSALVSEILMSMLQTVRKKQTNNLHMDRVQKKTALEHLQCSRQCKKTTTTIYIWTDSARKQQTIYIWTVHIYRLYRRQCAKYTYIYSVHIVYYKDTLNYQWHIIHHMGTSTLCTVSIHNVVYT